MHPTLSQSIRTHAQRGRPGLVPYLTAGFPAKDDLLKQIRALAPLAAAIEIGVPFSDPMADGVTIQNSSRRALELGVSLSWILDQLATLRGQINTPLVLMSYLNPLLSLPGGVAALADRAAAAGLSAMIVPDLPLEESPLVRTALHKHNIGLIQMVSPVTPDARAREIAQACDGFLYAVTVTGVTGAKATAAQAEPLNDYLDRLRAVSPVPVCAGFGIRDKSHVDALAGHADGAIVGSALIDALARGEPADTFLRTLI